METLNINIIWQNLYFSLVGYKKNKKYFPDFLSVEQNFSLKLKFNNPKFFSYTLVNWYIVYEMLLNLFNIKIYRVQLGLIF